MAMSDGRYAPAATLFGLVQRGRGLGARMALEDPTAVAELVRGCVRWDWRWDPADRRGLYLARLVRDAGLPIGPLADLLAVDEDTCERATGVLELLALGGSAEAREALRAHVREGEYGRTALESVAAGGRHPGPAEHGEVEDVPVLVAALERDWVERRWCGPLDTARQLARFGPAARDAVSLLRRFWLWTPHSSERAGYLEALAAIDPTGLDAVYVECLWDCEDDARMLGIAHAPDGPDVRARLAYLRDDPMEVPEVGAAAGARLAALTP
ncbi:hypothetical protein [Kitasatospora sp. NPDC050463]|uniref:hypothetical protein n=1 Tax=Kitasatospora sp. NPDC050463 TaxID=3155786 RepID=UPI00340757FB